MANDAPTTEMATLSVAPKGTAKRDALLSNEAEVQAMWDSVGAYEAEADQSETGVSNDGKFIVTFPYPYSNGHLHIGHAFSLTKADFAAVCDVALQNRADPAAAAAIPAKVKTALEAAFAVD